MGILVILTAGIANFSLYFCSLLTVTEVCILWVLSGLNGIVLNPLQWWHSDAAVGHCTNGGVCFVLTLGKSFALCASVIRQCDLVKAGKVNDALLKSAVRS